MRQDVIDKLLQDKLEESKQKGIAEGRQLALLEVAKNLSDKGYELDLISKITGLSITDIKQLLD